MYNSASHMYSTLLSMPEDLQNALYTDCIDLGIADFLARLFPDVVGAARPARAHHTTAAPTLPLLSRDIDPSVHRVFRLFLQLLAIVRALSLPSTSTLPGKD